MKTNSWFRRLFFDKGQLICVALFLAFTGKAQSWLPAGPPTVVSNQFITTGGITYFRLVGRLPGFPSSCCERIAGYAVSRVGTNLSQTIQRETWLGACPAVLCEPWTQELVSVLGVLPPGNYRLSLLAEEWGFPEVWAVRNFTVPTNSNPTLTVSAASSTNTSQLLIQVAGVSNAIYVLESSADFANWSPVRTNFGAPVTFSVGLTNGLQRYYRTTVLPSSQ